jgi:hypothetical protein
MALCKLDFITRRRIKRSREILFQIQIGLLHILIYTSKLTVRGLSERNFTTNDFPIVNFPFICSNIPAAPAYGVYISKLYDIPQLVD